MQKCIKNSPNKYTPTSIQQYICSHCVVHNYFWRQLILENQNEKEKNNRKTNLEKIREKSNLHEQEKYTNNISGKIIQIQSILIQSLENLKIFTLIQSCLKSQQFIQNNLHKTVFIGTHIHPFNNNLSQKLLGNLYAPTLQFRHNTNKINTNNISFLFREICAWLQIQTMNRKKTINRVDTNQNQNKNILKYTYQRNYQQLSYIKSNLKYFQQQNVILNFTN
eukprot:TRINITY_DN304_c0_g1_i6.p1 TRINITY_DN304_c0_g1~~TRINITY_DN304_c0_g1_i6.p1  ORF type:complete len:222 (+),score=-7.09 TRINITY_DN304_c0_g1_i6:443-1108(+)